MSARELQQYLNTWDHEASQTARLLRALPADRYDFRPDATGRTLGQLAWHLAEIEAYVTNGIAAGRLDTGERPPGIERPKTVAELAPGFERIHADARKRVASLTPEDLERQVPFFDGRPTPIRDLLWSGVLYHLVHHRGQLTLMCRLAGGVTPGLYGPNREESAAIRGQTNR